MKDEALNEAAALLAAHPEYAALFGDAVLGDRNAIEAEEQHRGDVADANMKVAAATERLRKTAASRDSLEGLAAFEDAQRELKVARFQHPNARSGARARVQRLKAARLDSRAELTRQVRRVAKLFAEKYGGPPFRLVADVQIVAPPRRQTVTLGGTDEPLTELQRRADDNGHTVLFGDPPEISVGQLASALREQLESAEAPAAE